MVFSLSLTIFFFINRQLRKIVNHPYLFLPEYLINDALSTVSSKFEVLERMLFKIVATKHKTLIFSQFTQLLDIMQDLFTLRGWKSFRLDGTVGLEGRRHRISTFNDPESDVYIFLLSTRAGGLGVNLQSADTVIIFDSDWNPHQDLQAQARAHRMGQKSEVRVFKLMTLSAIEEAVLTRTENKLQMDNKIIQSGGFNQEGMADLDSRESMLRAAIQQDESVTRHLASIPATTPEELNRYLARNAEDERIFQEMDRQKFHIASLKESKLGLQSSKGPQMPPQDDGMEHTDKDPTFMRLTAAGRYCLYRDIPEEIRETPKEKNELPAVRQRRGGRSVERLSALLDDDTYFEAVSK